MAIAFVLGGCTSTETGATGEIDAGPDVGTVPDAGATSDATSDTIDPFPAPLLDECITDGSAGEHTFACDGLTFEVSVPAACLERACGMIIDVHGYTMSGDQQDNNTRMRALGRERGYVVVQPNATPAPPQSTWTELDDDDVLAFAARTAAAFHIDPRRWYFTGFSQGGFMSWRFVCKHADQFAAIAPLAGCAYGGANACVLDWASDLPGETHILYSHGSRDTIVSGACMGPQRDSVLAAYELADPEVLSTDTNHTRTRWTNARGTTFELIEHDYAGTSPLIAGHCFPGSADPGTEPGQVASFACAGPTAYDWGTAVIDFFDAHVRAE